jgi:hypothetical protein
MCFTGPGTSHGKSQPLDFAPERNFPIGFKADDVKITL